MLLPRHSARLSIPLFALPLACTGDDNQDDVGDDVGTDTGTDTDTETGDGDGDGGPCTAPGTAVPDFETFAPDETEPLPTCSTGWASDAPLQDANWVVMIPQTGNGYYYSYAPMVVRALPGSAALLITDTALQWYDGQGTPGAEVDHGFSGGVRGDLVVVRESDQHVFMAGAVAGDIEIREFADGALVDELAVTTPGDTTRLVGLFEFSTDEWLIVGDEFDPDEGTNEAFFLRVDPLGVEVLRKATSLGYSYYYSPYVSLVAFDDDDNLLFGTSNTQFIVDPNDGTVLNPAVALAGIQGLIGSAAGSGFLTLTQQFNISNDGAVSLINGLGVNQWTQVYDRAVTNDSFLDVAARTEGGFVAGGVDGIWWQADQFQTPSQPLVVAFDGSGTAEWHGRLAIPGVTRSVSAAADGGVMAAGTALTGGTDYNDLDAWIWLASW